MILVYCKMVHITVLILVNIVYSGLDGGDRVALDERFRDTDAPPRQYDKEDHRFILKGKLSNKMSALLYLSSLPKTLIEYL